MLFIRTTLLLGLGVLVLPTDKESQARVYANAKTAVLWTSTFCERNPATCVQGRQAWGMFVQKAEFGFKMALDLFNERDEAKIAGSPATATPHATTTAPSKRPGGTLQANDLEPAWRGKAAKIGG